MKGKKKVGKHIEGRGGGNSKVWFLPRPLNIDVPNDRWDDQEFILASEYIKDLELLEKIEYVYGHSKAFGLFGLIVREIDGKHYEYGIQLKNYLVAQLVGWYYVEHEKNSMFEYFKKTFLVKLSKCQKVEKNKLIHYQLEQIQNLYNHSKTENSQVKNKGIAYGYSSELNKDYSWRFFEVLNGAHPHSEIDIKKTHFNYPYCHQVAIGAAYYKMEVWLLNLSNDLNNKIEISKDKVAPNGPVLALFCQIINASKIIIKGYDENAAPYCQRVCNAYGLNYIGNTRKYFKLQDPDIKATNKIFIKVQKLIIESLDSEKKGPIDTYLNSKLKMYT